MQPAAYSPPLSAAATTEYLFSSFGGALSQALLRKSVTDNYRDLLSLALQAERLVAAEHRPSLSAAFHRLLAARLETLAMLAAEPAVYHWVCVARMLVKTRLGAARDPVLDQYEVEFGLSRDEFHRRHLTDFIRIALGAAVLDVRHGSPAMDFCIPLTNPFSWVIPGAGMQLIPPAKTVDLAGLNQRVLELLATRDEGSFISQDGAVWDAARQLGGNASMPCVIDIEEACMRLSFIEAFPRLSQRRDLLEFEHVLTRALRVLGTYHEALAKEVQTLVRRVCPMHTAARAQISSGSVSSMFGAVFMSAARDPLLVAEMLLHEFGHNKLRLLAENYELMSNDQRCAFYSPWRNEPRPLDGVMHGLYVFALVARFWLWVQTTARTADTAITAQRRLRTLLMQLELGLEEFQKHVILTPAGQALLIALRIEIGSIRKDMPRTMSPDLTPLYVGPVRDPELLTLKVEESVRRHRQLFFERFPTPHHV